MAQPGQPSNYCSPKRQKQGRNSCLRATYCLRKRTPTIRLSACQNSQQLDTKVPYGQQRQEVNQGHLSIVSPPRNPKKKLENQCTPSTQHQRQKHRQAGKTCSPARQSASQCSKGQPGRLLRAGRDELLPVAGVLVPRGCGGAPRQRERERERSRGGIVQFHSFQPLFCSNIVVVVCFFFDHCILLFQPLYLFQPLFLCVCVCVCFFNHLFFNVGFSGCHRSFQQTAGFQLLFFFLIDFLMLVSQDF